MMDKTFLLFKIISQICRQSFYPGHSICILLIDSRIRVEYPKRYNAVHIQRIIDTEYLLFRAENSRSKWRVTVCNVQFG